ncbi:MAG: alpha-ketoglutarate-dependent dioxygenase AlkB [Actinomycetota bacterium]|jgi:alkylated DNA repair dioxygenase AlkB
MPNPQSFTFPGEILPYDGSAILTPDFLSIELANELLQSLLTSTQWENQSLIMFGKKVEEPRLSTWHADPHLPYTYSGAKRVPQPWTAPLNQIRALCEEQTEHTFNGVLVNLYRTGNDHLGWHSDDEKVNGPEPIIASISLGAERKFELRHKETGERVSTMLSHGSLLVMSGLSQSHWLHRIPKSTGLDEPRINLTFRHLFQDEM